MFSVTHNIPATFSFQRLGLATFPVLGSPVWPAAAILDSSAPEMILALSSCETKPFSTVADSGRKFFPFLFKNKKKKTLCLCSEK